MKTKNIQTVDKQPVDVGRRLRALRNEQNLSMRALAELSGLNVNTLSLIENGKTSPSVSTLQQLAAALKVPIGAFFESPILPESIVYQQAGMRQSAAFSHGKLADSGGWISGYLTWNPTRSPWNHLLTAETG